MESKAVKMDGSLSAEEIVAYFKMPPNPQLATIMAEVGLSAEGATKAFQALNDTLNSGAFLLPSEFVGEVVDAMENLKVEVNDDDAQRILAEALDSIMESANSCSEHLVGEVPPYERVLLVWEDPDDEGYGSDDREALVRLRDGSYYVVGVWSDTTGHGCQCGAQAETYHDFAVAVFLGLRQGARECFLESEGFAKELVRLSGGTVAPRVEHDENAERRFAWAHAKKDDCAFCGGKKGGTPGNENVTEDGSLICDYCDAERNP